MVARYLKGRRRLEALWNLPPISREVGGGLLRRASVDEKRYITSDMTDSKQLNRAALVLMDGLRHMSISTLVPTHRHR